MDQNSQDKRQAHRVRSETIMHIHTHYIAGMHALPLEDISANGAFLKSRMLPEVDDTVTAEVYDKESKKIFSGKATVRRVCRPVNSNKWGFAIEFENEFPMYVLDYLNK